MRATQVEFAALAQWFPSQKIVFRHEADAVLPAGSIIKILIAIALIEKYPGTVGPYRYRAVASLRAFTSESPFFFAVLPGDWLPVQDLLSHMIIESDNFAANILIDHLGISNINLTAHKLGLRATRIHDQFYDVPPAKSLASYTSPDDCNAMLIHILSAARRSGERRENYQALLQMMLRQTDRRFIPFALPRYVVANKTGEIANEINDCAIIEPFGNKTLIFSLLAHGGFNATDAKNYSQAVRKIQEYAFSVCANAYHLRLLRSSR